MPETCALFSQAQWCKTCAHCLQYVESPRFMAGCELESCHYQKRPLPPRGDLSTILNRMNALLERHHD